MTNIAMAVRGDDEEHAPLHRFEILLKLPVDLGMFWFGLANAGVPLETVGGVTASILLALVVGKICGIVFFSFLATRLGFDLPQGLGWGDLVAMSALAGVGLTVCLFVANEAFIEPELQGQAKMGAVLSLAGGGVAWAIRRITQASHNAHGNDKFGSEEATHHRDKRAEPEDTGNEVTVFKKVYDSEDA
jgi:NhaA family Na+:H+ antiporter